MPSRAAGTVEITVLAGMGWCGVPDVAPAFERVTGHKVIVHGEIVVAGVRNLHSTRHSGNLEHGTPGGSDAA